jgi:hypothetical protein
VSIPPEAIQVVRCYLTRDRRVRRVIEIQTDGEVRYKYRSFPAAQRRTWKSGSLFIDIFAATALGEVPCDWTPEMDEP